MRREGHHLDDRLAGVKRAVAMDNGGAQQAEAGDGLGVDGADLADGQFRIAIEGEAGDGIARVGADEAG